MEAQSLLSPRATAIGAYSALVADTRDFGLNPAGLTGLYDWDFSAVTYLPTTGSTDGFVFHGLTLGERFLRRHAAAMQFSNGTLLEVVFPAQGVIVASEPTTVDSRLSYSEKLALGYAFAVTPTFSAGLNARLREERITDTRYQLQDTLIVRLPDIVETSHRWLFDLGMLWEPMPSLKIAALGRNLFALGVEDFPADYEGYQLDTDVSLTLGAAYAFSPLLTVSGEAGTDAAGAFGTEIRPAPDWALRAGIYMSENETPFVYGAAGGLGWSYEFLRFDLSYLYFFDRDVHAETVDPERFDPSSISNIDLSPYSPSRISLSVSARFGDLYQSNARIDGVDIRHPVYPVTKETASYDPLGSVFVTNISDRSLHMRASFFIEGLMDRPTLSIPFFTTPGQQVEIPLTAAFNDRLDGVTKSSLRDAEISVTTVSAEGVDDRFQARVLIHGRNAWDGRVESLRYFVTPDAPEVLKYTRDILLANQLRQQDTSVTGANLRNAKILIDTFAGKLLYVGDPKQSADFVQYPGETLTLKGGDCDDMTVCFSSLLNSIGISTAFVDVIPPENPAAGHVYLMFDTGLAPAQGSELTENPKRLVVRTNADNRQSIWIPIETTVISEGFQRAWEKGAEEYYDDAEVHLGLIQGWVRIVDVY